MGSSRFNSSRYVTYSCSVLNDKTTDQIFNSNVIDPDMNPHDITMRESRDSEANPESNAIIIGLDVTGSMGMVLDACIRNLGVLMEEIYNRKPISDPHIMCMGIGDVAAFDAAPLQVTQFEADVRIAEQLQKIYIERGGGSNNYESYTLPWYFAATRTSIDCFEKRNKKGYLFTVGDKEITPRLTRTEIEKVLGETIQQSYLSSEDLLDMASEKYNIYHLMVEEGSHMRRNSSRVIDSWTRVIGQNAIRLPDHKKLAETVVTTIMINEGVSPQQAVSIWNNETSESLSLSFNLRRD